MRGGKRESAPALQGVTLTGVTLRQGRGQNEVKEVKEGDAPQAAILLLDAFPWEGKVIRGRSENRICGIMMATMPF